MSFPVLQPLDHNNYTHVPEGAKHEGQLRNKLEHKVDVLLEIEVVKASKADSHAHVGDSDDN